MTELHAPNIKAPNIKAKLTTIDGRESEGEFEVAELSVGERVKRSLKRLAIFWLIALLFLPFPAIHFVVPPAMLIVGVVIAIRTWFATRIVRSGHGNCPVCQAPLKFGTLEYSEAIKVVCPNCRNHLKIRLA